MQLINKEIVKQRFGKSIFTYKQEAVVQRAIAKELIGKILNKPGINYQKVLEIGCGTGFLTSELLQHVQPINFIINDLVDLMEPEIEKVTKDYNYANWSFIVGDAEKINFEGELDLVISSSTLQWFNNPASFFKSINKCIKKNGLLAFTTFGDGNFSEINLLLQHGLKYPTIDDLRKWLDPFFDDIQIEEKTYVLHFNSAKDVLKHIKDTGVNGIAKVYLSKDALQQFEGNYIKLFTEPDNKVHLTYNAVIVTARKKNE